MSIADRVLWLATYRSRWPSPSTSVSVMVMLPLGAPSPAWTVRSVNTPWPSLMNNATPPPSVLTRRSRPRSEEHTSELQPQPNLECRLLLEKKKQNLTKIVHHIVHVHTNVTKTF